MTLTKLSNSAGKGINISAIFNLTELPESIRINFDINSQSHPRYHQLILLGHSGKQLWDELTNKRSATEEPVDSYTQEWVSKVFVDYDYQVIYPGDSGVPLQQLGALAGWHFDSPFKVGINSIWGSWFAYRAVILANSNFKITEPLDARAPCPTCIRPKCVEKCPAKAISKQRFSLGDCMAYRVKPDSRCGHRCIAREACPIGRSYQYSDDQIAYHYEVSLGLIKQNHSHNS